MNYKIGLKLASVPAILGSVLASGWLVGNMSKAEAASSQPNQASCSLPQASQLESPNIRSLLHQKSSLLVASSKNVGLDEFSVDFSEAESDAAVTLFGCDCPACMNAFRQLRRESLVPKGEGHCMSNLARRSSPEKVKEVLKVLDAEEARNKQ
ncbi:MAG: hypothetical protein WCD18_24350 [Thermosynechococcaceae cyanobacterium]